MEKTKELFDKKKNNLRISFLDNLSKLLDAESNLSIEELFLIVSEKNKNEDFYLMYKKLVKKYLEEHNSLMNGNREYW